MAKANPLAMAVVLLATSFYFFPFFFSFLPGVNTKMMVAALGLVMFFFNIARKDVASYNNDFASISLFALGVSFASFMTMALNSTRDDSYLSYIVTMWVWLGGAYCVVNLIKAVHGRVSVELVCQYLIVLAVAHCLMAVAIDHNAALSNLFDRLVTGERYMGAGVRDRLHSFGCALDVAGGRFAAILVMAGYLVPRVYTHRRPTLRLILLLAAMAVITVIGCMIGRTTVMGASMALAYWLYCAVFSSTLGDRRAHFVRTVGCALVVIVMGAATLSQLDSHWAKLFRFGFEGFYNLVENGKWETTSSNQLKAGFVFPDNLRAWLIGDGYMASSANDPYYVGESDYGFYKNTDAGYCRFIFYFGLVGLSIFSAFFLRCCAICFRRFPTYRLMFVMVTLMNFIVWVKVATDLFVTIAPFLLISAEENDEYEQLALDRQT